MSESPIDSVEDRVRQLQEISQRREQLLREMYHLLQRRDDLGSLLKFQDGEAEDDGMQTFLERFNLEKNPEFGQIVNLSEVDILPFPLAEESSFEEQVQATDASARDSPDLDSPMSDAPPSPSPPPGVEEAEAEQQLQYPEGHQTSDVQMEVDEAEQEVDTRVKTPALPDTGSDDVLILESDDEPLKTRGVLIRKPRATLRRSIPRDDDRDELDLLGSPPRSRASSVRQSGDASKEPSSLKEGLRIYSSRAPSPIELANDEDDTNEAHRELPEASPEPEKPQDDSSKEHSQDDSQEMWQDTLEEARPEKADETSQGVARQSKTHTEGGEGLSHHLSAYGSDLDIEEVEPAIDERRVTPPRERQRRMYQPSSEKPSERLVIQLLGSPRSSEPAPAEDFPVTPSDPFRIREHIIVAPPTPLVDPEFNLTHIEVPDEPRSVESPVSSRRPLQQRHYSLPPLSSLPAEYNRKGKPSRQQRKKEKEREKNGDRADGKRDEWVPMGINKWGAIVRANPVHKKLARATKTVSTRDWNVAWQELRLIRTLEKIEALKDEGLWSFRQPKKQRGVGSMMKTHWDYLLDEVKWMRIDFREERRWKIAIAYTLAHAVIEWHEAGTLERRVADGICVLWKRPRLEETEEADGDGSGRDVDIPVETDERAAQSGGTSTPANDYGSDDDSDDEQEKDVADSLDPSATLKDAMEDEDLGKQGDSRKSPGAEVIRPKVEDIEDLSALHNGQGADDAMDVDHEPNQVAATKEEETSGEVMLKTGSDNPLLGSAANVSPKSKAKQNLYAPLRDQILSSGIDKLFIDLEDEDLVKAMSDLTTEDPSLSALPPPPDLLSIFPDLQPYGLLDVPDSSSVRAPDGRKKADKKADRDDPNRRIEDAMYTKVAPLSDFMHIKPTLLGTLEPALHYDDGRWYGLDDIPVGPEPEYTRPIIVDQELNSIFDMPRSTTVAAPGKSVPWHDRDKRRRPEHIWTPQDDQLLKQICDRYPNNWPLISDAFNSSRITIRSDKRNAWDCYDRWLAHLAPPDLSGAIHTSAGQATPPTTPSVSTPMTTRGNRRAASISMAQTPATPTASALAAEPKKRRRHQLVQDAVRKAVKRKEAAQKNIAMQRKTTAGPHETHMTFAKMPKYTPQELSRMKTEKEARDMQEQIHRRRVAELARQKELAQQQGPSQQPQQASQPHPPQPGVPNVNGLPRTPGGTLQQAGAVPQIRSQQVGISQQQRMALAGAGARLSPMQAQQIRAAQAAQAQAQAAQMQAGSSGLSAAAALNAPHLSPAFNARQASSSPAIPHLSPPHQAATPANAAGIPRPASTQMPQATPATAAALAAHRQASNVTQYYMPNMHGQQLTSEQMEQALARLNRQQEHHTHSANQMAQLAQNLHNTSYPPS